MLRELAHGVDGVRGVDGKFWKQREKPTEKNDTMYTFGIILVEQRQLLEWKKLTLVLIRDLYLDWGKLWTWEWYPRVMFQPLVQNATGAYWTAI